MEYTRSVDPIDVRKATQRYRVLRCLIVNQLIGRESVLVRDRKNPRGMDPKCRLAVNPHLQSGTIFHLDNGQSHRWLFVGRGKNQ